MVQANCPSCAGPLKFVSRASLYAVCPYCRSLVLRRDLDVESVGKAGELIEDGTPVQLGTAGRWRGSPFQVVGRIQLRTPAGTWNEWHLLFGRGPPGWLGETQGHSAVTFLEDPGGPLPRFEELRIGEEVRVLGERFTVRDIQRATCVSGEGELPFAFRSGYEAPVVDLSGEGRRFATLDFSEEPPLLFRGEECALEELELRELRSFEGW
jgi:Domain of unknown function (DUF4178)